MEAESEERILQVKIEEDKLVEHADRCIKSEVNFLVVELGDQDVLRVENWNSLDWSCYFCNHVSPTFETFKFHVESTHGVSNIADTTYRCNNCSEPFFGYASFIHHIRGFHFEVLKFCCDVCNEIFYDFEHLSIHRDKHVDFSTCIYPSVYYCTLCGGVNSTEKELKKHIQLSHNLPSSTSALTKSKDEPLDSFLTTDNSYQPKDEFNETNEIYPCGQCSESFSNEIDLRVHSKAHKLKISHQCKTCCKVFPIRSKLKRHGHRCLRKALLTHRHSGTSINIQSESFKEDFVYKCEMCLGTFKSPENLKSHMIFIHSNKRPYECKIRAKGLKATVREIRDSKNVECYYKCKSCDREYITPGGLTRHSELCKKKKKKSTKTSKATKKGKKITYKKKQTKGYPPTVNTEEALFVVEINPFKEEKQ